MNCVECGSELIELQPELLRCSGCGLHYEQLTIGEIEHE